MDVEMSNRAVSRRFCRVAVICLVVVGGRAPSGFAADTSRARTAPSDLSGHASIRDEADADDEVPPVQWEPDQGASGRLPQHGGDEPVVVQLSPEQVNLRGRVRACLAHYFRQHEDVADRSPWGIMHALVAYGADTEVYANGRRVNAIGWLCWNGPCGDQRLFSAEDGRLTPLQGPGMQGHDGQFLFMMAQARVPVTFPMKVDGYDFTIADLVEYEKRTCFSGQELTFKLVGLVHYLDSNARWRNRRGEEWDIPRMIKEELAQPVIGATCGGTHRMMGFTYAVRKREKRGEPIDGQWRRAKKYVEDYHEYAFRLQNNDGSFSTSFFRAPDDSGDIDRRLETTGHTLEWLVFSLPGSQLQDRRVVKAVDYLTNLLMSNRQRKWEVGPKGHALHALAIYDERVFGSKLGNRPFLKAGD